MKVRCWQFIVTDVLHLGTSLRFGVEGEGSLRRAGAPMPGIVRIRAGRGSGGVSRLGPAMVGGNQDGQWLEVAKCVRNWVGML